jgi:hypothetical protein
MKVTSERIDSISQKVQTCTILCIKDVEKHIKLPTSSEKTDLENTDE